MTSNMPTLSTGSCHLSYSPPKFTKGHLNASFQSSDLETGSMYKSMSINPFHYAPQGNRKLILDAATKMDEERNVINWRIVEKDRSKISSTIKGFGRVNIMEEVAMTCANICGIQLAMVDISGGKPLLYQFAWTMICFIESKKRKTWLRNNSGSIAHLPMVFMAKLHQFFMHLAFFSQNSINTNKIEVGNGMFETKALSVAVKLGSKFFSKMQEHVDDNSIPKDVPAFAKRFFVDAPGGGLFPHPPTKQPISQPPPNQLMATAVASVRPKPKRNKAKKRRRSFPIRASSWVFSISKKGLQHQRLYPTRAPTRTESASVWISVLTRRSIISTIYSARMVNTAPTGRTCRTRTRSSC
jgi:hypothetical protein